MLGAVEFQKVAVPAGSVAVCLQELSQMHEF